MILRPRRSLIVVTITVVVAISTTSCQPDATSVTEVTSETPTSSAGVPSQTEILGPCTPTGQDGTSPLSLTFSAEFKSDQSGRMSPVHLMAHSLSGIAGPPLSRIRECDPFTIEARDLSTLRGDQARIAEKGAPTTIEAVGGAGVLRVEDSRSYQKILLERGPAGSVPGFVGWYAMVIKPAPGSYCFNPALIPLPGSSTAWLGTLSVCLKLSKTLG